MSALPSATGLQKFLTPVTVVTIGFGLALIILVANAMVLRENTAVLRDHEKLVQHTQEVLLTLERAASFAKDAETGARGYMITGQEVYLSPFRFGQASVIAQLDLAIQLTSDNVEQQQRLNAVRAKITPFLRRLETLIDTRRTEGFAAAQAAMETGEGLNMMVEIRDDIRVMQTVETNFLKKRYEQAAQSALAVDRAYATEAGAILMMIVLAYYFIRRFLIQQQAEKLRLTREAWLKGGLAELSTILRGNMNISALCQETMAFFARHIEAQVGTFYVSDRSQLVLCGAYAGTSRAEAKQTLKFGEGAAGEAAAQKRLIQIANVPSDYVKISSSLGETPATHIAAIPLTFQGEIKGVIEVGSLTAFTPLHMDLFVAVSDMLGVSVDAAQNRDRMQTLLEATQQQAEELEAQQEELRTNNEELEAQAHTLKNTQDRLQVQQEELQQTNEELEQQARVLEAQKADLSTKNVDLTVAQAEVQRKAIELGQASQYKSEFLANMSHELRTPLNSMLILATLLAENDSKTLSEKQVEFARTIHRAGADLLNLINDILDLSKVEAGKLTLNIEDVHLAQIANDLDSLFRPLIEDKGLKFNVEIAKDLPAKIKSDRQRLEQILKNFLSNAIKFTENGHIDIKVERHDAHHVALSIIDSGIGIANDKQTLVFEAFQQADGSTSREFGGTGLGLTISRELANLLRSQIKVSSTPGKGSKFTLIVPLVLDLQNSPDAAITAPAPSLASASALVTKVTSPTLVSTKTVLRGDVTRVKKDDRLIVIVEDDRDFSDVLVAQAHEAGFKAISTNNGESLFDLVDRYTVAGILLDIRLPDVSGLAILERMKADLKTRHIPIHIISGMNVAQNVMKMGAVGYLMKPVDRDDLRQAFARIEKTLSKAIKRVLIVEDDAIQRVAMIELLAGRDIEIDAVELGRAAIDKLATATYDCMILDLRLPDISGFELLELIAQREAASRPPVVVYTGKELSKTELEHLRRYSESIIIKGAQSPARLLDEVSLFLHRVEANLPKTSKSMLQQLRGKEEAFADRKVLLVDDDMRNVFALANALDLKGLRVTIAKNGKEALAALDKEPSLELVLMDIMMPIMDGYTAMEQIRADKRFKKLPMIALTAKAMKGDQERCLAAGANDYLPKPIQLERLLSLLRVWLPPRDEL